MLFGRSGQVLSLLLVLSLTVACAGPEALRRAEHEAQLGNWDAAVAYYQQLVDEDPDSVKYQIRLKRAKAQASQQHQEQGGLLWEAGDLEQALQEYIVAVQLDPGNDVAQMELGRLREELDQMPPPGPTSIERAKLEARAKQLPVPKLDPKFEGTVSVNFQDASVREIYRALAKLGGLNVVFDQQVQDVRTSFEVQDAEYVRALELLTLSQGHFYKALSADTFLVSVDNATKRREYADQVIKTFYLSNAEAEGVAQMIRALLQARAVAEDPALNTVTIRDTPELVTIAERIVESADKARGEVLLDIEILEVNRRVLREYGVSLSEYSVTQSLRQGEQGISLNRLRFLNATDWFFSIPSVRYRLFKDRGDFKMVADPQLRLVEGEDTNLLIGEQVPIVTTTFSPGQLTGNQVVPIRSTQYRDVGIVIGARTRVHHNDEVTLRLEVEVSSIAGTSSIENLPIFGTRTVQSVIRLKDGETNILAGLLRDDERTSLQGIPGLSDIPVLGKLFASNRDEVSQTDVILSITPHILRTADIRTADLEAAYVGTEGNLGGGLGGAGREPRDITARRVEPQDEAQEPVYLWMEPDDHVVQVGDQFAIDVEIEDAVDVASVGLRLTYDPNVVELVSVEEGEFLGRDGAQTSFQSASAGAGATAIGATRVGDVPGVSGTGVLVRLLFQAVSPGFTEVEISTAAVRNPAGRSLPVEPDWADVEVEGEEGER